jgi:hypothetical protein
VAAYPVVGPIDVVRHGVTGWLDEELDRAVHAALTLERSACRSHAESYTWQRATEQFIANLAPRAAAAAPGPQQVEAWTVMPLKDRRG